MMKVSDWQLVGSLLPSFKTGGGGGGGGGFLLHGHDAAGIIHSEQKMNKRLYIAFSF
jgi:hypothetical protein